MSAPTPAPELARRLGVSVEAVELARAVDLVDLHVETMIPMRLFGYDPRVRHGRAPFFGFGFGHLDLPRAADGGLSGAMWSISTNVLRRRAAAYGILVENLRRLERLADGSAGRLRVVASLDAYRAARRDGAMACLPAVQGGSCLEADGVEPAALRVELAPAPPAVASARRSNGAHPGPTPWNPLTRVTLVHLTSSRIGSTSGPWSRLRRHKGLTPRGRALVEALDDERIFVDLAHAHPETFWDAVDVHDRERPLLATHTGVSGVHPCWRNLDDAQLRAIADSGGVVGIIWASHFLVPRGRRDGGRWVLEHLEHALRTAGEAHVGIGSDLDGFIIPPPDLRSAETYPRLVQYMLDARWPSARIERVLGQNFLSALGALRPGGAR